MALDKVIDSAQLDADLTSIADAIREKAGVSDSFAFPDGFIEAVSGISAGGGDSHWYTQTFIPAEGLSAVYIYPGFGKCPTIMGYYCVDFDASLTDTLYKKTAVLLVENNGASYNDLTGAVRWKKSGSITTDQATINNTKAISNTAAPFAYTASADRIFLGSRNVATGTASAEWQAGKTYVFVCGVI